MEIIRLTGMLFICHNITVNGFIMDTTADGSFVLFLKETSYDHRGDEKKKAGNGLYK